MRFFWKKLRQIPSNTIIIIILRYYEKYGVGASAIFNRGRQQSSICCFVRLHLDKYEEKPVLFSWHNGKQPKKHFKQSFTIVARKIGNNLFERKSAKIFCRPLRKLRSTFNEGNASSNRLKCVTFCKVIKGKRKKRIL